MIEYAGPPSSERNSLAALARFGIDLRPLLRRARDAILRPIRHELNAEGTAWRKELGDEANIRQRLLAELRADVAARQLEQEKRNAQITAELRADITARQAEHAKLNEQIT